MIRNFATFASSLPNDSEESGGDIVVPSGRNLMESMRSAYRNAGHDTTVVDQHSFYGWSFDVIGEEGRFWHMIQGSDPWLLIVEDSRPVWKKLLRGHGDFARFVEKAHDIISAAPGISDVRWFTEHEWHAQARQGRIRGESGGRARPGERGSKITRR